MKSDIVSGCFSADMRDKKIHYLFSHMPQIVSANLFISLVMVVVLWDTFPQGQLLAWLGAVYLLTIIRWPLSLLLYKKFQRRAQYPQAEAVLLIFSLLSGGLWGAAGIVFIDPKHTIQMTIVVLALMGMMSGAVASLSAIYRVYLAFSLMTWVPVTLHLFLVGSVEYYVLGGMAAFYVLTIIGHSLQVNKLVTQSLALRFENVELIDELRQQKELAEQANIDKSRFLAAASHDLRQPLHTMNLFIEILDKQLSRDQDKEVLSYIIKSSVALDSLFNALLDISKLDAGVVDMNLQHFRIQPLLDKVISDFKPLIKDKGLRLSVIKTQAAVFSDPIYLELILRNLISNAVHHTQQGKLLIGCRHKKLEQVLQVQVLDTGPGIATSEINKIFNEFYQLCNPERDRSKGLGLGLAIVKRLAELLQHPLSVSSVSGKGSCFAVSVQLGDVEKAHMEDQIRVEATTAGLNLRDLKVLALDDERIILKGLQGVLSAWGCRLSLAESLEQAISMVQAQRPDIMLVDYRLRGHENGLQAIAVLQTLLDAPVPAILITGDTAADEMLKTKASGLTVLHKPVRPAQLRLAMTRVLQIERAIYV